MGQSNVLIFINTSDGHMAHRAQKRATEREKLLSPHNAAQIQQYLSEETRIINREEKLSRAIKRRFSNSCLSKNIA